MSTLMFWNKQNGHDNKNNGKKNWLHAPDNLVDGHIVYRAKFLGKCSVDQPKGIEVVKDAIRKLQLSQQMKKFEQQVKKGEQNNSWKAKKVELSVSINGVAVRDTQTQLIMHQYPLYRISYCADEKGEKKYFSFIAKSAEGSEGGIPQQSTGPDSVVPQIGGGGGDKNEKHECFVFISSKNASDITLTIGQAFDLAYTKYKTDSEKTSEVSTLQAKNSSLEKTIAIYRQRLKELSDHLPRAELEHLVQRWGVKDVLEVPVSAIENGQTQQPLQNGNRNSSSDNGNLLIETNDDLKCPPVPSRNNLPGLDVFKSNGTSNGGGLGSKNDELLLNSDSDSDFDPRADDSKSSTNDFFGFEPTKTLGQQIFAATNSHHHFVNNMNAVNNSVSNGFSDSNNNSSSNGSIPAPLLAPPPKASTQRRSGPQQPMAASPTTNGKIMDSQDLFGSTPFHTAPISFESQKMSPFVPTTTKEFLPQVSQSRSVFESAGSGSGSVSGSGSRDSSLSLPSEKTNPFKFFDRIDQEIEENKQRLKEATATVGHIPTPSSMDAFMTNSPTLVQNDVYAEPNAKKNGYNALLNISFDQFSLSSNKPPIMTTTNGNYNAFTNDLSSLAGLSGTDQKRTGAATTTTTTSTDLQQNFIWG